MLQEGENAQMRKLSIVIVLFVCSLWPFWFADLKDHCLLYCSTLSSLKIVMQLWKVVKKLMFSYCTFHTFSNHCTGTLIYNNLGKAPFNIKQTSSEVHFEQKHTVLNMYSRVGSIEGWIVGFLEGFTVF